MTSHRPWDGYQATCRFDHNAVGRLVVWGPEGVFVSSVPLTISRPVHLGDCSLAFLLVASFCQVRLGVELREVANLGFVSAPRSTMPAKKDVASSSAAGPSGKGGSRLPYSGKPIEVLNE
ncbi:hypothetical protein CK203_101626 [Vitis vinifera]|uniref:Uncharacterized protein n=1 Tax=Vitis vinifera TaxID=29760 RepID=A0A438DZ97_VITVI|nr:hypothetical protein CK203_101626 [Vitis vinifera]